jgi:hypothetical protein
MDTANCTFCKRQISFGVIGGKLKLTHRPPHCQEFTTLSPKDFLKQSAYQICSDRVRQLRLSVN